MFFKKFSKYILAGTEIMSCACSLVYADKEADKLKAKIKEEIDEIIKKMPEEAKIVSLAGKDEKNQIITA